MRLLMIALLVLSLVPSAQAADWLVISGYSTHFERRDEYRADNPGIGWERYEPDQNPDWTWAAGYYRNSYDKNTLYAGARWEPLRWQHARLGVFLAAVSGYWTPLVAVPMLSLEYKRVGINLVAAPTVGDYSGYVGAQLKFKLN